MNRDQIVERYRTCRDPLLLLGAPGVGKTHLAYCIDPTLLRINCSELSGELMAAELFGTVLGAFTGAVDRPGLVESASTLFLDEAGELESALQAKLLALIDEGSFRRVGSNRVQQTDVRLIFATWRDPAHWMRPDLEDRFGWDVVVVPRLSDDELRDAIDAWAEGWNRGHRRRIRVRPQVVDALVADAAGSTRRLKKRLEFALRSAFLEEATAVELAHLPPMPAVLHPGVAVVREAFEAAGGDAARVAARFGISRSTAYRWRKSLGIRRPPE